MIDDWRVKFQLPDMYFGFVQLAPWIAVSYQSTVTNGSVIERVFGTPILSLIDHAH